MKPETEIRNLRRELKELKILHTQDRQRLHTANREWTKALEEAQAWRRRFDIALSKIPDVGEE